jgi:hypothetical protein
MRVVYLVSKPSAKKAEKVKSPKKDKEEKAPKKK